MNTAGRRGRANPQSPKDAAAGTPDIDTRGFHALVEEARRAAQAVCPHWTLDANDPGRALIEAFAYLSKLLAVRLNRTPEEAQALLMRLAGVTPTPPAAAQVRVIVRRKIKTGEDGPQRGVIRSRDRGALEDRIEIDSLRADIAAGEASLKGEKAGMTDGQRAQLEAELDELRADLEQMENDSAGTAEAMPAPDPRPIVIPRGARLRTADGTVFEIESRIEIPADRDSVTVTAWQVETREGVLLGRSDGGAGQSFRLPDAPLVAPAGEGADIFIGVARAPGEAADSGPTRTFGGETFSIWSERDSFARLRPGEARSFVCDRGRGLVYFPPRGVADAAPPAGAEIRAWFRVGGGSGGNLPPGALTTIDLAGLTTTGIDATQGVEIEQPEPATGGADGEDIADTVGRAFYEIRGGLESLITASDFEIFALGQRNRFSRASARARADRWRHAAPGVVEMLVSPTADKGLGRLSRDEITARQSEGDLEDLRRAVAQRLPLGIHFAARWFDYRPTNVAADIVIFRDASAEEVERALHDRLHAHLSPENPRWNEQPRMLHRAVIQDILMSQTGVRHVENVRIWTDAPAMRDVRQIAPDAHQPRCWHAAAEGGLYRSLDNGLSWMQTLSAPGETAQFVRPHPLRPGAVAALLRAGNGAQRLVFSEDCGQGWRENPALTLSGEEVLDICWALSGEDGGSSGGLYLARRRGDGDEASALERLDLDRGVGAPAGLRVPGVSDCWALESMRTAFGRETLAVAVRPQTRDDTFAQVWVRSGEDAFTPLPVIRAAERVDCLALEQHGGRLMLWAGLGVSGGDSGRGVARIDLAAPDSGWEILSEGWGDGRSCESLSVSAGLVCAGTGWRGLLVLDDSGDTPRWTAPRVDNGLPYENEKRLKKIVSVGARLTQPPQGVFFAATEAGLFMAESEAGPYREVGAQERQDTLRLPRDHLPCSGAFELRVRHPVAESQDAADE